MGLPAYGRGFKVSGTSYEVGGASSGGTAPQEFTGETGYMAYYEICDQIKQNGWKTVKDDNLKSMYAYHKATKNWVGYENKETLQHRCTYINDIGLAGAMFWDTSLDDMHGLFCDEGSYPLIGMFNTCLN